MENNQSFIWADDLKKSLSEIDTEFSKLPDAIKIQGIYRIASYPPDNIKTVVSEMWDKYCGLWRKHKNAKEIDTPRDSEQDKKLIEQLNSQEKNSVPVPPDFQMDDREPDHIMFKRKVRIRKGKWSILPPEAVKKAEENGDLE